VQVSVDLRHREAAELARSSVQSASVRVMLALAA
jgi:hypothetical protein